MDRDHRRRRVPKMIGCGNSKTYLELKDIIMEDALKYLPAKLLCRFQAVCRDWKHRIVSPFFQHSQSNSFRDISGFFCQSGSNLPWFLSLDSNAYGVPDPSLSFLPEPVEIRASSNGLICCRGRCGDKHYYICNPVTKQWKQVPKPNNDHGPYPAVVLIFEPSLLNFVAEYKLICAFQCADFDNGYEFEMYSSRDGSWKYFDEIYLGDAKLLPMSGVHVNGIVYWTGKYGELLLFDLATERTRILQAGWETLGVMDGKLCLTRIAYEGLAVYELSNAHTNTMEMNSRVRTWELKHQIDLGPSFVGPSHGSWKLFFASGNWLLFKDAQRVYAYDIKTKERRCLCDAPELYDTKVVAYVNSLVEL